MRLPGRSPATDEMSTIDAPSSSSGSAAWQTRKWARVFTANTSSQCSALVPGSPTPAPMPTLSTSPSRPPSRARRAAATTAARRRGSATSATMHRGGAALGRAPARPCRSAAASSRSAHATAAPSRAARTAMARPLPTGASGSADGRVPAPTTRTRRPASRLGVTAAALDAVLALHAEAVQREGDEVVLARRPCTARSAGPRSTSAASAAHVSSPMWASRVQLVGGPQERRRRPPTTPGRRPPGRRRRGDLVGGEPGVEPDADVLAPLVVGLAVPRRAQDQQLPLPGRQLAGGRGGRRRTPTTASAAGGGGRGWRRCSGRGRRRRGPQRASSSAVRSSRSSGAAAGRGADGRPWPAVLPVGARDCPDVRWQGGRHHRGRVGDRCGHGRRAAAAGRDGGHRRPEGRRRRARRARPRGREAAVDDEIADTAGSTTCSTTPASPWVARPTGWTRRTGTASST